MLTLFNVASLANWPDVLISSTDTQTLDGFGPVKNNSVYMGLFFILFLLIGSYFSINFFIGVLFLKYT